MFFVSDVINHSTWKGSDCPARLLRPICIALLCRTLLCRLNLSCIQPWSVLYQHSFNMDYAEQKIQHPKAEWSLHFRCVWLFSPKHFSDFHYIWCKGVCVYLYLCVCLCVRSLCLESILHWWYASRSSAYDRCQGRGTNPSLEQRRRRRRGRGGKGLCLT